MRRKQVELVICVESVGKNESSRNKLGRCPSPFGRYALHGVNCRLQLLPCYGQIDCQAPGSAIDVPDGRANSTLVGAEFVRQTFGAVSPIQLILTPDPASVGVFQPRFTARPEKALRWTLEVSFENDRADWHHWRISGSGRSPIDTHGNGCN
jgi:hypothetical protein